MNISPTSKQPRISLPSRNGQAVHFYKQTANRGPYKGAAEVGSKTTAAHRREAETALEHAGCGSITKGLELVARKKRREFDLASRQLQFGRTMRMTADEGADMQSFVGMTTRQVRRQRQWYLGNGFGVNTTPIEAEMRALTKGMALEHNFTSAVLKDGEKVTNVAIQQAVRLQDVFEASARGAVHVPEVGEFAGTMCFKPQVDRGGGQVRAGIVNASGHKESASRVEYWAKYTDAPDDWAWINKYVIADVADQMLQIRDGSMLLLGNYSGRPL